MYNNSNYIDILVEPKRTENYMYLIYASLFINAIVIEKVIRQIMLFYNLQSLL